MRVMKEARESFTEAAELYEKVPPKNPGSAHAAF
jgi:hypothetical protein